MKNHLLFLLLLSLPAAAFAQPVKVHCKLKVTGIQLMSEKNEPVVLNGMSFGWSCFHPRFYTAGAVKELHKEWNCNVVRAAMGVEPGASSALTSGGINLSMPARSVIYLAIDK